MVCTHDVLEIGSWAERLPGGVEMKLGRSGNGEEVSDAPPEKLAPLGLARLNVGRT